MNVRRQWRMLEAYHGAVRREGRAWVRIGDLLEARRAGAGTEEIKSTSKSKIRRKR